jgi:hypothetical protein
MAETAARPTLCFTASFPLDADLGVTAAELANRLAVSGGLSEDEASALGRSVEAAFAEALNPPSADLGDAIELSLCAGDTALDLSMSRGSTTVLTISRPRP